MIPFAFSQEKNHPPDMPAQNDLGLGEYSISGKITHKGPTCCRCTGEVKYDFAKG
jgi:hypothetical protein